MTDIEDLRAWASGCGSRGAKLCLDAADEIESLRDSMTGIMRAAAAALGQTPPDRDTS